MGPNVVIDASDDILKGVVLTTEEEKEDRRRSVFRSGSTVG